MLTIKKVNDSKTLKAFVTFPNQLYKDNPYYVPDLIFDEIKSLSKDKNPAYEFSEAAFFLAYKGREIVGRIGTLVNHKSNEKWKQKNVRFTHFDFIDDLNVSKSLMNTAEKWAIEKGYNVLHGPLGFTDMDHQGMLIEGFDELDMYITSYNYPYYKDHMITLGFKKDVDWIEYQVTIPDEPNQLIAKLADRIKKRSNYQLVEFKNKKDILPWAKEIFNLYNEAYTPLYGTTELTQAQIDIYIKTFFGFVNPDFIKIIIDKDNKIAAFGITMPSISKAMQKAKGRLFPFGFVPLLRAIKKNDTLDMYLIAVRPDLQGLGVNALLIDSILKTAITYGMKLAETGPELELNKSVQSQWRYFDTRCHKKRRIWTKNLV